MSFFYRSERVGKNGKIFSMLKIRTLKEGRKSDFAHEHEYTWCGRFLRKWRLDESPQLWQVVTRRLNLVGPRPMEPKTLYLYPPDIQEKLTSIRPGLFGLAGVQFMDEEKLLSLSNDPTKDYVEKIMPLKLALDLFYIEHKCWSLDVLIIYLAIKKRLWT